MLMLDSGSVKAGDLMGNDLVTLIAVRSISFPPPWCMALHFLQSALDSEDCSYFLVRHSFTPIKLSKPSYLQFLMPLATVRWGCLELVCLGSCQMSSKGENLDCNTFCKFWVAFLFLVRFPVYVLKNGSCNWKLSMQV